MPELIPRQETTKNNIANAVFYLAVFLFVASIVSFFVLNSLIKNNQENLAVLEISLLGADTPERRALENKVLSFQRRVNDFDGVEEEHLFPAKLFSLLEENTHPNVMFDQFNLDSRKDKLVLNGKTLSFETLGQQLLIFKEADFVKEMVLDQATISKEGYIIFTISLTLDSKILYE